MMGRQVAQGALFYGFRLDEHVPVDHLPSHHVRDPLPSAKSESRLHRRRKHAFFNSLGPL
jgi:hypothetical protein